MKFKTEHNMFIKFERRLLLWLKTQVSNVLSNSAKTTAKVKTTVPLTALQLAHMSLTLQRTNVQTASHLNSADIEKLI